MQNSTAFKTACLGIGLATAWSPLGVQEAKADSVLQVNLNFGTSAQSAVNHVYLGLLLNNSSVETYSLDQLGYSFSAPSPEEISGYVAIGMSVPTTFDPFSHVWVSFSSVDSAFDISFDQRFVSYLNPDENENENVIAQQLSTYNPAISDFIGRILNGNDVRQAVGDSAGLAVFSPGSFAGGMDVSFANAAVPLPNAVVMGGALLVLLSFGNQILARRREIA